MSKLTWKGSRVQKINKITLLKLLSKLRGADIELFKAKDVYLDLEGAFIREKGSGTLNAPLYKKRCRGDDAQVL